MRFLIFFATVAHMAIISGATLTGQVIPDEGISIESTIVNLYEKNANTVLSSASVDTSGNFSLDCDGSCSVAAQQMSEGALVALSHRIQFQSNKSHVRLQLSAKRTIFVHASVPETEIISNNSH